MWHVSIARLNRRGDRILPVEEWPRVVRNQATDLQKRVLKGVGGTWELLELGESAIHLRRRLSAEEMSLLHQIRSDCPVFTHGEALSVIARSANAEPSNPSDQL